MQFLNESSGLGRLPRWALLVLIALAALALRDAFKLHADFFDRRVDAAAFYCGGTVAARGADPYEAGNLAACERRYGVDTGYLLPVPLPPYDLAAFAAASGAGYESFERIGGIAIVAAGIVAALALASLGIPLWAALAALGPSTVLVSLPLGQIYPFAIAFACVCAAALQRGRFAVAGVAGALALVSPQIGIPVALGVALWVPRARVGLFVTGAVLALAGTAALGPASWVHWLHGPLASQVRFEAGYAAQYSLTSALTFFGVPSAPAIVLGGLSTLLMLALALYTAGRFSATGAPEYCALIPPALCVLGGSFAHLTAIEAAIPLALVLAFRNPANALAAAALVALSIPWAIAQEVKPLFFSFVLVAAILLGGLRLRTAAAVTLFATTAALLYLIALHAPPALLAGSQAPAPDTLRELAKLPTWLGLIGLVAAVVRLTPKRAVV